MKPNQLIASTIQPAAEEELRCLGELPAGHIESLLSSRERTQRFTGVKLARLAENEAHRAAISGLANDVEEDVYIRLEGVSYLAAVCGEPADGLFQGYLRSADQQTQLEAVISLGETANEDSIGLLSQILDDASQPYFIRSAAAWCLSRIGQGDAAGRLIRAFGDINPTIREEALDGIVSIGGAAVPLLLAGLREVDQDIAAGCAEALRQQKSLRPELPANLIEELKTGNRSPWGVWLLGHLPRETVGTAIAELQESAPQLHYAIALLWSFVESWISRRWELHPGPDFPLMSEL